MEIEKSKVSIQFLLFLRQSGDVLFFLYARRLRRYTATILFPVLVVDVRWSLFFAVHFVQFLFLLFQGFHFYLSAKLPFYDIFLVKPRVLKNSIFRGLFLLLFSRNSFLNCSTSLICCRCAAFLISSFRPFHLLVPLVSSALWSMYSSWHLQKLLFSPRINAILLPRCTFGCHFPIRQFAKTAFTFLFCTFSSCSRTFIPMYSFLWLSLNFQRTFRRFPFL